MGRRTKVATLRAIAGLRQLQHHAAEADMSRAAAALSAARTTQAQLEQELLTLEKDWLHSLTDGLRSVDLTRLWSMAICDKDAALQQAKRATKEVGGVFERAAEGFSAATSRRDDAREAAAQASRHFADSTEAQYLDDTAILRRTAEASA